MFEFGSMSLLNIVIPKGAPSSLLVLEKGRTAHKRTHTHERFGGRGSREKGREVRNGKRKEPWSICKKRKSFFAFVDGIIKSSYFSGPRRGRFLHHATALNPQRNTHAHAHAHEPAQAQTSSCFLTLLKTPKGETKFVILSRPHSLSPHALESQVFPRFWSRTSTRPSFPCFLPSSPPPLPHSSAIDLERGGGRDIG